MDWNWSIHSLAVACFWLIEAFTLAGVYAFLLIWTVLAAILKKLQITQGLD